MQPMPMIPEGGMKEKDEMRNADTRKAKALIDVSRTMTQEASSLTREAANLAREARSLAEEARVLTETIARESDTDS